MNQKMPLPYPHNITIYGNTAQNRRLSEIGSFIASLTKETFRLEIWQPLAEYLQDAGVSVSPRIERVWEPSPDTDLILTLGGDGTLLHALPWSQNTRIPLLGINTGHLGYLTAYTLDNAHCLLRDLAANSINTEPRQLLQVVAEHRGARIEDFYPLALNEVAILKDDTSSMINIHACINGTHLVDYKADGLIIATPTGSTGYNLSVGGPIIDPRHDSIILTPIAPHTLSMRPIVLAPDDEIQLSVTTRADTYRAALDGRSFTLPEGAGITITTAAEHTQVAQPADRHFADTLRNKLSWG